MITYGYKHVVKLLLECSDPRFDLNAKYRMGWTALMLGCKSGHKDVVELLLGDSDRRIDLNARGRWGRTALVIARKGGHRHIVRLIEAKLNT